MSFFDTFNAVKALFPLIGELVSQAEVLFPQGGVGQHKLEMVKTWLQSASVDMNIASASFDNAWTVLKPVIDTTVEIAKIVR